MRILRALDDRPVFVVGSPRSGTSYTAASLGSIRGLADLGELSPLKRVIPLLASQEPVQAARRIRRIMGRAQRLGQLAGLRVIEQTPECTFLIPAIAHAYPRARFVHMIRDGRDVASSLIGLGWLHNVTTEAESDEVGHPLGSGARFWVEPARAAEFTSASEATRAAWVWRRYESAARENLGALLDRSIEIRYERLVDDPAGTARELAEFLDLLDLVDGFVDAFSHTVGAARGRWKADLSPVQLANVLAESGPLLRDLGYTDSRS